MPKRNHTMLATSRAESSAVAREAYNISRHPESYNLGTGESEVRRHGAQRGAFRAEQEPTEAQTRRRTMSLADLHSPPTQQAFHHSFELSNDGAFYEDNSSRRAPNNSSRFEEANHESTQNNLFNLHDGTRPERDLNSGSSRPTTSTFNIEELLCRMAEIMTAALKRFADGEQNRRRWRGTPRSLPYKFAGQDHEDPEWFLERLGEYFTDTETYEDSERIEVFREKLQDEARQWFDNSIYLVNRYRELETLFLERYNSPELIAHLLAKLYGEM